MNEIGVYAMVALSLIAGTGYAMWKSQKPKHVFLAWDGNTGSIQPYGLKTLSGNIRIKLPDKKKVSFPMGEGFSMPRQDGKGVVFLGDTRTGRLMRPQRDGTWVGMDGITMEASLADGRVESLARATNNALGITLQHIAIMLVVVMGLIAIVIYQYANGSGA